MTIDMDIRVAELLCSRLCHELVSPIGAINNGVELIEEMGEDMTDEAIALIAHSAGQAARRLRLLRLAYGAAGAGGTAGFADAQQAASAYFTGGKISLDWPPGRLPDALAERRGAAKMLLNLLVLGEEALAYGGTLRVDADGGGPSVVAEGRAAGLRPETRAALEGSVAVDALSPRTVHAFATGSFAASYGFRLDVVPGTERLELRLNP
ncbi:histidine phosphotransferase family protein [Arenibaculum sp.]|uniref:histidine phosphotransferase family protein n=1 Tax=Arenibaculum sp. TaxID=2865862 RepID=UPI002E112C63|nr:histidine phosphotransferase family protein [Arenibaculum sp.]